MLFFPNVWPSIVGTWHPDSSVCAWSALDLCVAGWWSVDAKRVVLSPRQDALVMSRSPEALKMARSIAKAAKKRWGSLFDYSDLCNEAFDGWGMAVTVAANRGEQRLDKVLLDDRGFKKWSRRVMKRAVISYIRKETTQGRNRQRTQSLDSMAGSVDGGRAVTLADARAESPLALVITAEFWQLLSQTLTPRQLEQLTVFAREDSLEKQAEQLEIAPQSVKVAKSRLFSLLKYIMGFERADGRRSSVGSAEDTGVDDNGGKTK